MKKKIKKIKSFTAIDTNQSSFVQPAKGRQFKLAKKEGLYKKKKKN